MSQPVEQTMVLAAIERKHGQVLRIPDESDLGEQLLAHCLTDTRAYVCENCLLAFTIEPDGDCNVWALVGS